MPNTDILIAELDAAMAGNPGADAWWTDCATIRARLSALQPTDAGVGEPDGWQHRVYYEDTKGWSPWRDGKWNGRGMLDNKFEERPLYASPEAVGVEAAWRELVEKDDRTSPEDYPDMALITKDELADYMGALASPAVEREAVLREAAKVVHDIHLRYADERDRASWGTVLRDSAQTSAEVSAEAWRAILELLPPDASNPTPPKVTP